MNALSFLTLVFLFSFVSTVPITGIVEQTNTLYGLTNAVSFGTLLVDRLPSLVLQAQPPKVSTNPQITLSTIDRSSGSQNVITTFDSNNVSSTLPFFDFPAAYDPESGQYFVLLLDQNTPYFYVVDLRSGKILTKQQVTGSPLPSFFQWDQKQKKLFGLFVWTMEAQLVEINIGNAQISPVGPKFSIPGSVSASALSSSLGSFFVFSINQKTYQFITVSTTTGRSISSSVLGGGGVIQNAVFNEKTGLIFYVQGTWFGYNFTSVTPQGVQKQLTSLPTGLYWESLSSTGYVDDLRSSYSCVWLGNDSQPKIAARIDELDLTTGQLKGSTPFDIHHIPIGLALV